MKLYLVGIFLYLLTNFMLSEEPSYEKFISTTVEVNGKTRPLHLLYQDSKIVGFFIESKYWTDDEIRGYGGPINLQIYFTMDGKIQKIKVIEQYETEVYAREVFTERFLSQFYNKDNTAKFSLGKDIQAISGATISCTAVNEIIYQCVNNISTYLQKQKVNRGIRMAKIEILKIFGIISLFAFSILGYVFRIRILRYLTMVFSIYFLGIVFRGGISVGHLNSLLRSNLLATGNLSILLLIAITIVVGLIFGRLYCGWLCPFGAVIEILFDIKRFFELRYKKSLGKEIEFVEENKIVKFLRKFEHLYVNVKYVLLVIIIVVPTVIVLEPFQYLFLVNKTELPQMIYLVMVLTLSIIFVRIWCRYFCPLGGFLALLSKISVFKLQIDQQICLNCETCKTLCPTNAIVEKRGKLEIISSECIACNECYYSCGPKSINFVKRFKKYQ